MKKDNRKPAFDIKAIKNQLAQLEFNELNAIKPHLIDDMIVFGQCAYKATTDGVTILSQEEIQNLKDEKRK